MITAKFYSRDFQDTILPNPPVVIVVERWSHHALGGPYEAQIAITGPDLALWEFLEYLRRPVEIISEQGDAVWWGYVAEVEVIARNPQSKIAERVRVGASLDTMYNRVAIAWEDIVVGERAGPRETTDWADDDFSQDEYGIKEGLFSGESASDQTLAEQARDTLLERKKYPTPIVELNWEGDSRARIFCRGWWDTMNWKYATVPEELALSFETYNDYDVFGDATTEQVGESIHITGGDINLSSVQLRVGIGGGAPSDDLSVDLYSVTTDGSGNLIPNAILASSGTVDGGTLDGAGAWSWETFTFAPEYTLVSGSDYYLVLNRSGAQDAVNYYKITVDNMARYGAGTYATYDGANWNVESLDAVFRLYQNDLVETSTQVLSLITRYGQFFRGVESDVSSGVESESYRDGDGSAHYETEQLLQHGTDNLRRMLVKVDKNRWVLIYEEPEQTDDNMYLLYTDGRLRDHYNSEVRQVEARAGIWVRLTDVIPATVDATYLNNTIERFMEITEYDAVNDKTYYTARDELNPFVVGRPYDG